MLYNSLSYLVFFVVVLAAYWSLRTNRARLALLLIASWLFYAAWYPRYLVLLLFVTAITYLAAIWIADWRDRPQHLRLRVVAAAVAFDLAILAYFKYAGFLLNSVASIDQYAGGHFAPPALHVVLPLGISFYTFQSIAYIVDVYRGDVEAVRNPLKLALFKAFFPQLIAGPIVRADELVPQFASKRHADAIQIATGLDLIASGLIKKVLVADRIAVFADRVFAHPEGLSSAVLLLGIYAYAAQIYCDFSGYTDIGRGCAKLLGLELPLNFDAPYTSVNIVDFWRRWHMSLSRWLRDYLYIPLGGSRRGKVRTYVNLFITMLLGGLWHGANWTFVTWGAYHGSALALTRLIHNALGVPPEEPLFRGRAYRLLAIVVTFHLVCLGWVLFRAPSFEQATFMVRGVLRFSGLGPADIGAFGWITLAEIAVSLCFVYAVHAWARLRATSVPRVRLGVVSRGLAYAAVIIAMALASSGGSQQFIYFQF